MNFTFIFITSFITCVPCFLAFTMLAYEVHYEMAPEGHPPLPPLNIEEFDEADTSFNGLLKAIDFQRLYFPSDLGKYSTVTKNDVLNSNCFGRAVEKNSATAISSMKTYYGISKDDFRGNALSDLMKSACMLGFGDVIVSLQESFSLTAEDINCDDIMLTLALRIEEEFQTLDLFDRCYERDPTDAECSLRTFINVFSLYTEEREKEFCERNAVFKEQSLLNLHMVNIVVSNLLLVRDGENDTVWDDNGDIVIDGYAL